MEAGKLERARDLVERLHHEKSFDLAMELADNHRKLVDLIELARDRKFGVQEDDFEESPDVDADSPRPRISPESVPGRKRPMDDTRERNVRSKQAYA